MIMLGVVTGALWVVIVLFALGATVEVLADTRRWRIAKAAKSVMAILSVILLTLCCAGTILAEEIEPDFDARVEQIREQEAAVRRARHERATVPRRRRGIRAERLAFARPQV